MTYMIMRTEHAHGQLMGMIRYIAEESQSIEVALQVLDRIEEKLRMLETSPHIGSYPRYAHLRRQGFRVLIVEKYLVFYKCSDLDRTVTLYHFVDSRTDYARHI